MESRLEPPYDDVTLNYARDKEEEVKNLNDRLHTEELRDRRNRNPYFRDYGRVLYSSSFRRLQRQNAAIWS